MTDPDPPEAPKSPPAGRPTCPACGSGIWRYNPTTGFQCYPCGHRWTLTQPSLLEGHHDA